MMLIPAAAPPGPPGVGKHLAAAAVAAPRAQAAPEAAPATDAPTAPPQFIIERGVRCVGGQAFYRPESAQGRDLAMLAARLHKRQRGALRVLDLMAGSGVRGARYLLHAEADEVCCASPPGSNPVRARRGRHVCWGLGVRAAPQVWCNDFNPSLRRQLVYNLCSNAARAADSHSSSESPPQVEDPSTEQQLEEAVQQWEQQATAHALPGLRFPIHEWTPTSRQAPGTSAPSLSPSPLSSSLVEVDAASSASPQPPCSGECSSAGAEARNGSPGPAPVAASDVQAAAGSHQHPHQPPPPQQQQCARPGAARVRWSSMDAKRLLAGVWLREDYPDLLDIDSFGRCVSTCCSRPPSSRGLHELSSARIAGLRGRRALRTQRLVVPGQCRRHCVVPGRPPLPHGHRRILQRRPAAAEGAGRLQLLHARPALRQRAGGACTQLARTPFSQREMPRWEGS